jgi:acyl-coenzyme A synthetase/AMP-(fatty) acid ligase
MYFFFQVANYLKDIGVKKGDAVIIYLPMLMELPITMLACARIGAVHSVSHKLFCPCQVISCLLMISKLSRCLICLTCQLI